MSERHFEQSMNPKKHIQSELEDYGILDPSDWRKALVSKTLFEDKEGMEFKHLNLEKLLSYLNEEYKISEKEKIEEFSTTQDSIKRLEILSSMSLVDAFVSIYNYSVTKGAYKYLAYRLDFYLQRIQKKTTNPEDIRLGLLRDIQFAAMIGTPELGIYKIVNKRLNEKKISKRHMPWLKGYYSGIHHKGIIGYAYPVLGRLYENARKHVEGRMGDKKAEEQVIEHRSVILASNWLEEAMNYNDPERGQESPYVSSLDEAIAWGRLGTQVKRQLRGMRWKIREIDLHKIERFVGKSGDNKYDSERKRLFGQIKFLKDGYDQEEKQEFTIKENGFAVQKQHKWHEQELERLNHKLEKSNAEIKKANLPDEERYFQFKSVLTQHQEAVASLEQNYQTSVTHLQERTPDQLLADLEQRQILVNERYEKRKSLAQKALDLHFKINHTGEDYDSKPFTDIVDWINYVPFGTIKRAHKMMRLGMSEETITEYAIADITAGTRCATREDIRVIHNLVSKAKGQDWGTKQKLRDMMEVGSIISLSKKEVTLKEISELAGKNFYGMTEALKMYSLEQVKQFMDQDVDLQSITTARKITKEFGYDLAPNVIAEIASHDINGLEDGLRSFGLDDTTTLLRQDVELSVAVAVLNNTKQLRYELNITQIANIAKNVHNINDFISALQGLPLSEVEKLFTIGVSYSGFSMVREVLKGYRLASDFNSSLSVAQKLMKNSEYDSLKRALEFYQLNEIDQIISEGLTLASVIIVRESLEKKCVITNLQETIQFTKYAIDSDGWINEDYVGKAIDTFGIDNVRKIVAKDCRLDKAIEVNNYINGDSIPRYIRDAIKENGLDLVIAIAKADSIEAVKQTLGAGFSIEEIMRFPYLISPLVTKK